MLPTDTNADLALLDLKDLVNLGAERGSGLLDTPERTVVQHLLSLDGPSGRLYARLVHRVPDAFDLHQLSYDGVPDPIEAADVLREIGLCTPGVAWSTWLEEHARIDDLKVLLRACKQSTRGRRQTLLERAQTLPSGDPPGTWVTVHHAPLVRRLVRFALLDKRGNASDLVLDRLGVRTWPDYEVTDGHLPLHEDRAALLRWEALDEDNMTAEQCLVALERGDGRALGRLSRERRLRAQVLDLAHTAERAKDYAVALDLYEDVVTRGGVRPATIAVRHARTLELMGRPLDALQHLQRHRGAKRGATRLAIHRSGRRVARAQRRSWAPDRPLKKAPERVLKLAHAGKRGSRPVWRVADEDRFIEDAVVRWLAEQGRSSLHSEGSLVRTLAALLFAETFFLPVTGALPVPRLPGPLDLGTRAFAEARAMAIQRVWQRIDEGQAPQIVRTAARRWHGTVLAWVRQPLDAPERFADACIALGPAGLRCVLTPLIEATGASRGLPDLLVCDGNIVSLDAFPSTLPNGGRFVEIKGPGDTLSDEQRVWHDRLLRHGVPVEVWKVQPL